jgi:hypothetical protein
LLDINHFVFSKLRTVDEIAGVKKSIFLLKLDIFLLKLDKRRDFIWILEKIDHLKKRHVKEAPTCNSIRPFVYLQKVIQPLEEEVLEVSFFNPSIREKALPAGK